MKGFREKCEKPPLLGILGQNGQFWTVFGQNEQNGNFFQKSVWKIFFAVKSPQLNAKFQKKVMKGFREKCKKPPFLGILAKNGPFWTVFGQNGRNGIFFQKSVWKIFFAVKSPN